MQIRRDFSLLPFNTFGIDVRAEHFCIAESVEDLRAALESGIQPRLILSGGSNIVFTRDVAGLVIKNNLKGIRIERQTPEKVWVTFGGGEIWHDVVLWSIDQNLGGIENMSLIPGAIGAAPVQNIGAYGVELKDVFVKLEAIDMNGQIHEFSKEACQFGYRDSIFKREAKGKYWITSVTLALTPQEHHQINLNYGDIRNTLEKRGIEHPTIADVSQAVIDIRKSKLPDPAVIGNCGSFFKNPETDRSVLEHIRQQRPDAPAYDLPDGRVKIPAGWLIEQCGWKGKRVGNTGSYEKQALVLVNYGGATGEEVGQLARRIIESVEQQFGVRLEPEVNIL